MDYKYIKQLLERYWAAETSLEEEEVLRAFFSQTILPAELETYRPLFVYERREKQEDVLGDDFERRMLALVGMTEERGKRKEESGEKRVVKARRISLSQRMMPLFRAAAVVAIILTLGNAAQVPFQQKEDEQQTASVEQETPEGVSVALNAEADSLKNVE